LLAFQDCHIHRRDAIGVRERCSEQHNLRR
jgi:hypothetical protein